MERELLRCEASLDLVHKICVCLGSAGAFHTLQKIETSHSACRMVFGSFNPHPDPTLHKLLDSTIYPANRVSFDLPGYFSRPI